MGGKKRPGYDKEYRQKNKEILSEKSKQYHLLHKEEIKKQRHEHYLQEKENIRQKNREYYLRNRESIRKQQADYHENNKDKMIKYNKNWYQKQGWKNKTEAYLKVRAAVFTLLGGKCARCGFDDPRALQIDHKNGNGLKEAKAIGYYGIRNKILAGNIKDYQLLCANCNWIKRYENNELGTGKIHRIKEIGEKR